MLNILVKKTRTTNCLRLNWKIFFCLAFLSGISIHFSHAQINLDDLTKGINKARNGGSGKGLSNDEVIRGLKEALNVGSNNASGTASKLDGYYKNPKIKIPFPKETQEMESTLRNVGMGPQVDKFVLSLNRAAEDAAKDAAPIFLNSIKSMTITDGMTILKGKDDAATSYLKNSTNKDLIAKFRPVVKNSLQKVEVTKYWNPLASRYNQLPLTRKMNPNLEEYVTQKAIEGLFYLVAQEELKIRKDPMARVTDILKKVFGN